MKVPHELRPGNRYWRPEPRSLRQVAENKAALQITCRRCRHRHVLYPQRLIARYGPEADIYGLARKLRCTRCAARGMAAVQEVSR